MKRLKQERPRFSIPTILAWADGHRRRTGRWPQSHSGPVCDLLGENWRRVDNAFRYGHRGLAGGSSLAKLLEQERGVRNRQALPALTERQILKLADAYFDRHGKWPTVHSGRVGACETWQNIDAALREGLRGLPGGSSLARLLAQKRSVANRMGLPRLTIKRILEWADQHFERTGQWQKLNSGWIAGTTDTSLAQLLERKRGVRNKSNLPSLSREGIMEWIRRHYRRYGRMPTANTGHILGTDETWKAVEMALFLGLRGLKKGTTLAQLVRQA